MSIDLNEMERLAEMLPTDDLGSYRTAARGREQGLDEDVASGARGWLSGVLKALGTWTDKMKKGGASIPQMAALGNIEQALKMAMSKMGEERVVPDVDLSGVSEDIREARADDRYVDHGNWVEALNGALLQKKAVAAKTT